MYEVLEIRRKNGNLVGLISLIGGIYQVTHADTEQLRKSLNIIIDEGIEDVVQWGNELIRFNAHPLETDFLGQVQSYLNICYDFDCAVRSREEFIIDWDILSTPSFMIELSPPIMNYAEKVCDDEVEEDAMTVILTGNKIGNAQEYFSFQRW